MMENIINKSILEKRYFNKNILGKGILIKREVREEYEKQ